MNTIKPQKTNVSFIDIDEAQLGQRLDNFLSKTLGDLPRTRIYRIIRKGEVRVNKKRAKPDYKLQMGDIVRIPPVLVPTETKGEYKIPSKMHEILEQSVIYETEHLLIINKPAGLAVHAGSGIDYGVIDIIREIRPDIAIELLHRLDRDTSGCLLLAKHRKALLAMQDCLQSNSMRKVYTSLVKGRWPPRAIEVDHPLKKYHLPNGERRVGVDAEGKSALSLIKPLELGDDYSLIEVEIVTGRTHQIRVHCQTEGHPIAGDNKYGDKEFNKKMRKSNIRRLMLHASRLELPKTDYCPEVVINAQLPKEFPQ